MLKFTWKDIRSHGDGLLVRTHSSHGGPIVSARTMRPTHTSKTNDGRRFKHKKTGGQGVSKAVSSIGEHEK